MYNAYKYNQPLYNITSQLSLYHLLLDGSYRTRSLPFNRVMVIGKDTSSNQVSGADEEAAELALVGERLDFRLCPSISTASLAAQVADAALQKARLDTVDGFIALPPNCGAELWDVITIIDPVCAQDPQHYRVTGIMLIYDPQHNRYLQRLTLGGV